MPYKLTTLCVATFLLGGCSMTMATGATDACDFWRPVSWSTRDTPETIQGVKINNARQQAWCKKQKLW